MSNTVLLTGAAGFLGTQVARLLVERVDLDLVALVRGDVQRLARTWSDWPGLAEAIGGRIEVLCGDISQPHLGLSDAEYDGLVRRVTHVIHTAADLRLNAPIDELRITNVQGTANLLELARAAHRDHGLVRFSHVSTAYVAGGRSGPVPEEALTAAYGFSSAYERSKYEAELLVDAAKAELPISVLRPGMIVGDSRTGAIKTFNTFYFPLRLYLTGKLRVVPASPRSRVNLVPVDYVAEATVSLTFEPRAAGLNFHLTSPSELLPTAGELVAFVREWARERLDLELPRPLFLPLPVPLGRSQPGQAAERSGGGTFHELMALLPYFSERHHFERYNVDRLLGPYDFDWRKVLPHLLDYAVYAGFMHRTGRTVHEQVLARLGSKSRPVTYHDIVDGQIVTRSAAQVRQEMLAAAGALRVMGICPGDRVALVGLNSTRYLALDVAIGLVGAVSVPLYYTSPPSEIDALLQDSGARLLFVGAPRVLDRWSELKTKLPVVSFCRQGSGTAKAATRTEVLAWDEFLALGAHTGGPAVAPVGFGDPATIRYTSGTTGQPKGVVFRHDNLRWMAESLNSLLPWQARNRKASYLSFLPMNHVVEGILSTYSPYDVPAPLDIYFLENFGDLQHALPLVRPTVFFSVPRFYEKVWEGLQQSALGRRYLTAPAGPIRQLLRPVVRRGLLEKAGLDRCAQLLVGSAPSGTGLLAAFQELGIEIHNAYGLTEAPLVSINRLGANRLGTVGEPLPMTEVRLSEDGEVLVRGPQVTAGYLGQDFDPPFVDGWLQTGDLGHLTSEGSLVLDGRKKELIATSYAKKIHPGKVEAMLREIPGITEAMLVGERRPYCVGLLWVRENNGDRTWAQAIDDAVRETNAHLSHPEEVKRWAILNNDLSIDAGDLTANLKLKREAVARRFRDTIEALYDGGEPTRTMLHLGRAEKYA
jgi:long-chain acyl-CoA synthetase